ncbi:hypothetical protein BGZ74_010993 [Mortierella antarctica]|nr:hypothetical protein BGZ74_010993 [Mortierella antarctica]
MSSSKITLVCVLDKHPLAEVVEFDVSEDSTGRDLKKEIRARMAHIIHSNLTAKQLVVWSTEIDPDTNGKEVPVSAKTHRSFARRERLYLLWPSRPAIEKVRSKWIIKDILPKDKKTVMIIKPKPGRQHAYVVVLKDHCDDYKRPETTFKLKRVFEGRRRAYRYAFMRQKELIMKYFGMFEQDRISPTAFTTDLLGDIEGLDQESVQARLANLSWKYKYKKIMKLYQSMLTECEFTMEPSQTVFLVLRKHVSPRH